MQKLTTLTLMAGCALLAGTSHAGSPRACSPQTAQVVALDECDPDSFNAPTRKGGLGSGGTGFCHEVALSAFGFATTLSDLIDKASKGTPDPGWDFEPDTLRIKEGTTVSVVDQGGEPHTFTEVSQFGGGFIPGLNAPGEETVPECSGGFAKVKVARTRLLQGSDIQIPGLSKGEHRFQCCIHPWMRVKVEVK